MLPYILTFGEDIYNPQQSLEFYRSLEDKYAPKPSEIGSSTLAQMFLAGKIGLYLSGRWLYPKIKESANFDWDVITFTGTVPLDASGWAIYKKSNNKENAVKLIKFLSSKENITKFTKSGLIVPARVDVANSKDFLQGKPNSACVFLDVIFTSKPTPVSKNYNEITDEISKKLEPIFEK